jgi:hypothetical protein
VLKPAGIFHLNTMAIPVCEEHRRQFDPRSRCLIRDGNAMRQFNFPDDIEKEITGAGFIVPGSRILPRRNDRKMDLLLLDATKSRTGFFDSLSPLRAFPAPGSQRLADGINNQYTQA